MGLKWYWGLIMPFSYFPTMDEHNHANQLHTISPSELPANYQTPVPLVSPNIRKLLPPPTPPTKGKRKE
jgi:hypothetical protein